MSKSRVLLIAAISALALGLIGWGSRAGYRSGAGDHALLRLSWRLRGERIENCRNRTQQELDALPAHMRTPRLCETRSVPYRLIVTIDGGEPHTTILRPAGARHDRPIYVLQDSALAPGTHHVTVVCVRADRATPLLRFDGSLNFFRGYIELITVDESTGQLVHESAR
jgi:hypothetical protein